MVMSTSQSRSSSKQPIWKRRGYDSREHMNQQRRYDYGTNGSRQKARDRKPAEAFSLAYVGDEKARRIDEVFDRLDALAGPERSYPRDAGMLHLYSEGQQLFTTLDERPVIVTDAYAVFERLRYRIQFADGVSIALTQGQLNAVIDTERTEAFEVFSADLMASFLELMAYREQAFGNKRGSRRKDVRNRK